MTPTELPSLPCPFCGEQPYFEGDAGEWRDDGRYVELSIACCAKITEGIGWMRARDMTVHTRTGELKATLTAAWNKRADTPAVLAERERQQSLHMRRLTGLWRFGREVLPVANISFEAFLFQLDGFINEKTQAHPLTPPAKEPT